MNLNEWEILSTDQRKEMIVRWRKNNQWDSYERLAGQAAEELRERMASISEVTGVEIGGGDALGAGELRRLRELVLIVHTLLPEASRLEHIPDQFKGFHVQRSNLGDKREAFLKTWKKLFKELKGWNEEQTLRWAERWADALSGREPSSTIYHYGPVKVAVSGLLEESAKCLTANKLNCLRNDILMLLMHPNGSALPTIHHPDAVEEYDWKSVRQRFEKLIEKYNSDQ